MLLYHVQMVPSVSAAEAERILVYCHGHIWRDWRFDSIRSGTSAEPAGLQTMAGERNSKDSWLSWT